MPSPFPGMDPYIESQRRYHTFHTAFITACADLINDHLPEPYFAAVEERVLVDAWEPDEAVARPIRHRLGPDVGITVTDGGSSPPGRLGAVGTLTPHTLPQETITLDQPTQKLIEIYGLPDDRLVTTVELLSPSNKRPGADREAFLQKRADLLRHGVNLVDLDLLLAGRRIPLSADLPPGDYFAMVTRADTYDRCDVFGWAVRDSLPVIPVPLAAGEPEIPLDLAAAFSSVYSRSHYDRMLRYQLPLVCPMSDADRAWAVDLAMTGRGLDPK
jgi:hypothetical protein